MSRPDAQRLNLSCACRSPATAELAGFFTDAPVFVNAAHLAGMRSLIAAVHRVTNLPAYQEQVLGDAPLVARWQPRTQGVFAGYDFHVSDQGASLIEINTNAGGAMLNAVAGWRHPECCEESGAAGGATQSRAALEAAFMAMFREEWRRARGARPWRTVAIVDDQPTQQFLYPEFELFAGLFAAQGIEALILDPSALRLAQGRLWAADREIDLVYNRVTDFYFEEPGHAVLRQAYLEDAAVITPHPRAHALLADKRNLVRFTDAAFLESVGACPEDVHTLQQFIPATRQVSGDAVGWWQDRKRWFFKPAAGFGSRGAYRGDKLTRRVFGEILQGGYVAQRLVSPGERLRHRAGQDEFFKVDLRHYVYGDATLLLAARLYQGQTTNFRTIGGGFAPVIVCREN